MSLAQRALSSGAKQFSQDSRSGAGSFLSLLYVIEVDLAPK
jgi:hypothetical protein